MSAKFYTLLTDIGAAKLASATALGMPLKITHMAVGDGDGTLPLPSAEQVQLVAEKRRAELNMLYIDPQNSSQIIAEQVIPETEGGWWIREVGLFDETGSLIAVGNCPESYKPQLTEGSGRTQTVRMVLITSSTDNITLKIDPSVVLATRKYVDDKVLELQVDVDGLIIGLSGKLSKDQNGADIPEPDLFIENIGLPDLFNKRALITGDSLQKFLVQSVPEDNNSAVPVLLLNSELNKKAALNGDASQGFAVAGGNSPNSAVAYNQFQSGSNGNGAWVKMPGDEQRCRHNLSIPANSTLIWTFPAAFSSTPALFVSVFNGAPNVWFNGASSSDASLYNANSSDINVNVLAIW